MSKPKLEPQEKRFLQKTPVRQRQKHISCRDTHVSDHGADTVSEAKAVKDHTDEQHHQTAQYQSSAGITAT